MYICSKQEIQQRPTWVLVSLHYAYFWWNPDKLSYYLLPCKTYHNYRLENCISRIRCPTSLSFNTKWWNGPFMMHSDCKGNGAKCSRHKVSKVGRFSTNKMCLIIELSGRGWPSGCLTRHNAPQMACFLVLESMFWNFSLYSEGSPTAEDR